MDAMNLMQYLYEAAYVVNENRKILYCNPGFERITGYNKEEIVGKYCYDNILRHVTDSGKQLCHDGCPLHDSIAENEVNETRVYLHHKEGHRVPVKVKTIPFLDDETQTRQAIEIFTDFIEESKVYQENRTLKTKTRTDELTQTYNRRFMDYQMDMCIKEFKTFHTPLALLFIDVDHFKRINDRYGHDAGDKVLKTMTKSIAANIRKSDFLGRFGGEEFIVLLRDVSFGDMQAIAEKLRVLISNTHTAVSDDEHVEVTVSIGCSYYHKDMTKEQWIKQADALMYEAKSSGRNKIIAK